MLGDENGKLKREGTEERQKSVQGANTRSEDKIRQGKGRGYEEDDGATVKKMSRKNGTRKLE